MDRRLALHATLFLIDLSRLQLRNLVGLIGFAKFQQYVNPLFFAGRFVCRSFLAQSDSTCMQPSLEHSSEVLKLISHDSLTTSTKQHSGS